MKSEEQYYIGEVEVYVTRDGNGIVEDRHLKTDEDYKYYRVSGKEIRYRICGHSGPKHMPARLYESHIQGQCYFASSVCYETRKYIRPLDSTYFKYFDDAEEVLKNIINFTKWSKNLPKGLKKMQMKRIVAAVEDLIADVPSMPNQNQYLNGSSPKKIRKNLSPFARDLEDEMDLESRD